MVDKITPQYKKWDLTKGSLSINGQEIVGFQEGDLIAAEYTANRNVVHMSADGFGRLSKNPCKHGTITIGLSGNSPALSTIQTLVDSDEPLVISYKDFTAEGAYVLALNCGIDKDPAFTRAQEIADVVWPFVTPALDYKHGTPILQ